MIVKGHWVMPSHVIFVTTDPMNCNPVKMSEKLVNILAFQGQQGSCVELHSWRMEGYEKSRPL